MKNLQYYLIETAAEMRTVEYIFSKKEKKKIMKDIRYHLEETAAIMDSPLQLVQVISPLSQSSFLAVNSELIVAFKPPINLGLL